MFRFTEPSSVQFSNQSTPSHCAHFEISYCVLWGLRWHRVKALCYSIGKSLVRFQMESLEYFIHIKFFRSQYGPGFGWASNRNEYQVYILRVKSGRRVRLITLPTTWAIVTKSGNLNFLEPSGYFGPVMGLIKLILCFKNLPEDGSVNRNMSPG